MEVYGIDCGDGDKVYTYLQVINIYIKYVYLFLCQLYINKMVLKIIFKKSKIPLA